jgi:MFS family permease
MRLEELTSRPMTPSRPSLYTLQFIIMAIANLFVISSMGMFYLLPVFIESSGGTRSDVGIIMGAIGFSSVLCRPWTSGIPDRLGRKRSYILACAMMASVPVGFLFLEGAIASIYVPIVLLRLAHGVALALYFTAGLTYVVDIVPSSRLNEGVGMFGAAGLAGMALGPYIAETILSEWGFHVLFATASAVAIVGLSLHLPLPGPPHSRPAQPAPTFFSVLRKSKTLIVVLLSSLFGVGLAAITNFVIPCAIERGIMPASAFFISYSASAIAIRFIGGGLADRFGERKLLPFALALTGTGFLVLSVMNRPTALITAGLMTGCGTGFLFPCLGVLAIRGEPSEIRGKLNGIFTGSIDAGIFFGSILLGYLGQGFGYATLFIAAALTVACGIIAVRRFVPSSP